jgi:hypothetical protein
MSLRFVIHLLSFVSVASLLCSCALASPVVKLKSGVIEGEETWRGEVQVDGIVTVKKTGRLIIEPGTRILFVPRDEDGDGIGDAELLVEGSLQAVGTASEPILFTSAAKEPRVSDWKYLYLDFARDAQLSYVISEYAYSGLQVHFSRARVTNSVFRHNVDGLRFSTVNLEAAGNRIYDNKHGLRYEERNGMAYIHHNDIRDNEIGIFVVTRSTDKSRIERNNIADNRQYNVKLGWQQQGDVTLPNNWWGGLAPHIVQTTFLDRKMDASLGSVSAPEPLTDPVELSNWQQPQGVVQ